MINTFDKLEACVARVGLPSDPQSERLILGSVLIDSSHMETIRDLLAPGDFIVNANSRIWARICKMHDAGEKVDHVTLASGFNDAGELQAIGGVSYLVDLEEGMPRLPNLDSYIQIVRKKSIKRRAIVKCHETALRLANTEEDAADVFAETERALEDLNGQLTDRASFRTPEEIILDAGGTQQYLQRRCEAGIQTPFPALNQMTGRSLTVSSARARSSTLRSFDARNQRCSTQAAGRLCQARSPLSPRCLYTLATANGSLCREC